MARGRVRGSWSWIAFLVLVGLSTGIKIVDQARADGGWDTALVVVISLLGTGLLVWLLVWGQNAQTRRFMTRVAARRPGATLVLSLTTRELKNEAARVGAVSRRSRWSAFVVAAVTPDTVELWARRDTEPRWSIRRVALTFAVVPVDVDFGASARRYDALQITDGSVKLVLVPTPPSVWYVRSHRLQTELEGALQAFDREPSTVPGFVGAA